MLDIWIVFWRIRDQMVNIVVIAPPTDTQTPQKIGNRYSPKPIDPPIPSQLRMSRVVRDERDLMPECSETDCCEYITERSRRAQVCVHGKGEESRVDQEGRGVARDEGRCGVES